MNHKVNMRASIPVGVLVVAFLMVIFGLAEVVTGFRHEFFGLHTAQVGVFTYAAAAIGLFYVVGGLLLLLMKKWAAALAFVLLCADIVGRIALVLAGLYPLDSAVQTFAIIAGTAIAVLFAVYIVGKWATFR